LWFGARLSDAWIVAAETMEFASLTGESAFMGVCQGVGKWG
jgi:hypothetical protein